MRCIIRILNNKKTSDYDGAKEYRKPPEKRSRWLGASLGNFVF